MTKMRLYFEKSLLLKLVGRFGVKFSELNSENFEVYNKTNVGTCPYVVVRQKLRKKPDTVYLVDEMKNMVMAGTVCGQKMNKVSFRTVLYLDGRDGYKL
jgi:hypothetical protein